MIDLTFGGFLPDYVFFCIVIIFFAVVSAYALSTRWMIRIALSVYIALALVLLLPDEMLFDVYVPLGLFVILVLLFTFTVCKYIVSSSVSWSEGKVPGLRIVFAFLLIVFIVAVTLTFMPAGDIPTLISKSTQKLLIGEAGFFVWAAAPIVFLLIFAPRY